jgi:FkbM family methyltransferase
LYSNAHFVSHLRKSKIDLVLDVGANIGQFASELIASGYKGKLISFEPLSQAHGQLLAAAHGNPMWEVATRCALGAESGTTTINISANSYSSSLRKSLDLLLDAAPQSAFVGSEDVPVQTLEAFLAERFPTGAPAFALKLDTQGSEADVLHGLGNWLDRCNAILLEMPLDSLYVGAADLPTLVARLQASGFRCVGMSPGHKDQETGDCIEVDGLFVRDMPDKQRDQFPIFTSIPPNLSAAAREHQLLVLDSWRAAGFTPISINSVAEAASVSALNLGIEIETVPTEGKPIISEMLSVILRRGCEFAGIINADCKIITYPHLALSLRARLDDSLLYAERIDLIGGQPIFDYCCGGFDAFFFDARVIEGIKDRYFRIGETWWDYWFPLRLAANGAKIANIHQPLLLHERHPAKWDNEQWRANAEVLWQELKKWSDWIDLPPSISDRLHLAEMGQQAGDIADEFFDWLRNKRPSHAAAPFPPEYEEFNKLVSTTILLGFGNSSEMKTLRKHTEALQKYNEELRKNMESLRNSKSWKITAPLRSILLLVRGLRTAIG